MHCWFLADIICSMPLSVGTLKIYVAGICRMDLKTSKSNVKIKIAFTTFKPH